MDETTRIEAALDRALAYAEAPGAPPRLAEAMRHAVFPGGARVRARLCLAVARACGDADPSAADAAAAAIELLHCASLVHDDLPCFDDADTRRGKPTLHVAWSEPIAVLAGDALIVLAFETLARGAAREPRKLAALTLAVARSVGMPHGICAGQAWESEPAPDLSAYQRAKTGALFVAACVAGATAAGGDPAIWRALGDRLGEAYQVADDLRDAMADAAELGKPVGQDAAHERPNAVAALGLKGAVGRLRGLVAGAVEAIPDCPGRPLLEALVMSEAKRLVPRKLEALVG
ncbi:polyprenyl synthetase family protein [Limibaculum sp. FT325]|uniref:polyprenyl synthetase family protein n=1 Tax=Thermohalobaculum sediminis TaxID=2939436 RepID=UPI0020BF305E|nr:polyprenyl synthetase family protein [Limibaculum sediminis]MCL5778584.1 polyprenyl synthetase family protein [Limibaculum sediminis]